MHRQERLAAWMVRIAELFDDAAVRDDLVRHDTSMLPLSL